MDELTPFEGKPVVAVGVEMPNAAGGLQEAMKFDPVEWHQGDEGFIVLHYTTQKVRFEPINRDYPAGDQRRVHVLTVDQAAPIDAEYVEEQMAEHRKRIKKAKDEAKGTPAIPGVDEEGDEVGKKRKTTARRGRGSDSRDQ